jgi:hypothetical protein
VGLGAAGRGTTTWGGELNETARAHLHQALDQAIDSVRAGRTVDADEAIRRVLSRP